MLQGQFATDYETKKAEIEAYFDCPHTGLVENRQQLHANGRVHVAQQCVRCGKLIQYIQQINFKPAEIADLPRYDEERRSVYTKERSDLIQGWRRYYERQQERVTGRKDYGGYLASPEWRRKRTHVMKRCGGVCEGCGEAPAIVVHHLTYEPIGNEFLGELRAVCRTCHDRVHLINQEEQVLA